MADFIPEEVLADILRFLRPWNAMAIRMEMNHGMRIGDVLAQRWDGGWQKCLDGEARSVEYIEQKTGKKRVVWPLQCELSWLDKNRAPGSPWLFPGANPLRPRTRQAVWKDLHEVARLYRVDGRKLVRSVSTHTARKIYAVRLYNAAVSLGEMDPLAIVMKDLNHADRSVTFLYALADVITTSRCGEQM